MGKSCVSKHGWTLSILRGQNTSGAIVNFEVQLLKLRKSVSRMKLCNELASFKMEHVLARKAHLIAAMIRWDMSRELRSFHTCCDRSDSLLWYRIFFVIAEAVGPCRCVGHIMSYLNILGKPRLVSRVGVNTTWRTSKVQCGDG